MQKDNQQLSPEEANVINTTATVATTKDISADKVNTPAPNTDNNKEDSFYNQVFDTINNSISPELKLILLGALSSAIAGMLHNKFFGPREQVHCSHTVHHN